MHGSPLKRSENMDTIEDKIHYTTKKAMCMKHGNVKTDNNGHCGNELILCGVITDEKCLQYRINRGYTDFGYLNSEDITLKVLEEIGMNSAMDINYGFVHLNITKEQIEETHPDLWFRVMLTSKHIVIAVKKEDSDNFKGQGVCFDQVIREYVDWTHLEGNCEAEEFLLETMKNHKRILGRGEKPLSDKNAKRCCNSMKHHALRTKSEIMTIEEIKRRKIPEMTHEPAHTLTFAVQTENGMKEMKFSEFLRFRIRDMYAGEWEEYLGEFESDSMQDYLRWLYESNEEYGFISVIFKK